MNVHIGQETVLTDEDIRAIQKRVRLGMGDSDYMVSIEETVHIYRLLQKGELQIFPNTPHPLERVSLSTLTHALFDFF